MELFIVIAVIIGLALLFSMRSNSKKTAEAAEIQLRNSDVITIPSAAMAELRDFLVEHQSSLLALKDPKKEIEGKLKEIYTKEVDRGRLGAFTDVIVQRLMNDAATQCKQAGEYNEDLILMWTLRILVAIWQLKHNCTLRTKADQEFVLNEVNRVNLAGMVMLRSFAEKNKSEEKTDSEPWTCGSCNTVNPPSSSRCDCGNRR